MIALQEIKMIRQVLSLIALSFSIIFNDFV